MNLRKTEKLNREDLGVLVLAAGKSTRIQPVSGGLPKPLLPVEGKSILERNLSWLVSSAIESVWINLHYRAEEIQQVIGTGENLGLKVSYSLEPEILGTAGAYKNLEQHWQGTTLVIYGDSLVCFDLAKFLAAHQSSEAVATIALFDQNTHHHTAIAGGRVILDENGRITSFTEMAGTEETSPSTLVNAAVYLLEAEVLKMIPKQTFYDFARHLFPQMLAAGYYLQGYLIDGYCLGLDTPESYAKAMSLIETGKVKLA
ncbi:nucleotidyltransferase family protein [Symplocastrum sp. BBK-W-15]|uniref:Nucleotidyltransferase family protein n=1 Tax=Limnofasciculus baicalensis BBK-W-15 TaxID=2699891 RepID=A0AAE3GQ00_9CYAN|nr:nucleotidyltransferase family protein [Limnofasciculus baicalensis BBK-W-15]